MKRFVIGDIHGNFKALKQCFDRSGFDHGKDLLISLGDLCDRNTDSKEVLEELLSVKNFKMVLGNHDLWFIEWAKGKDISRDWAFNGGDKTIESYKGGKVPGAHIQLFENAETVICLEDKVFVHGGLDLNKGLDEQERSFVVWDRGFLDQAVRDDKIDPGRRYFGVESIFIGHTPTFKMDSNVPRKYCNIHCVDTGAGHWGGKLTIMDIDTKEYWQSDSTSRLYGDQK